MRKLILAAILFSTASHAATYSCNKFTLFQGDTNGNFSLVDTAPSNHHITITTSETEITVQVDNSDMDSTVFLKDYDVFRNDTGMIEQRNKEFTMKTAVPDPTGEGFLPVKIIYHCK